MITLKLKPQNASFKLLASLAEKNLIRTLEPPKKVLASSSSNGAMQTIYCARQRWGGHKLICVKKNSLSVKLNFHPENEEFILINNNGTKFRPLCIIMGLLKQKQLRSKFEKGKISENDFMAVVFAHNDHKTCIFTMLKDTVHCEVALPGPGEGPVFFVAEPSRLKLNNFKTKGYEIKVEPNGFFKK